MGRIQAAAELGYTSHRQRAPGSWLVFLVDQGITMQLVKQLDPERSKQSRVRNHDHQAGVYVREENTSRQAPKVRDRA